MGFSFEFEDSEVASIRAEEDKLLIRFSAASAIEARTRTAGYLRGVELVIHLATWQADLGSCFGRLSGGRLVVGEQPLRSIPAPGGEASPVAIELQFRHGETLSAHGSAMTVSVADPAAFFESHAC